MTEHTVTEVRSLPRIGQKAPQFEAVTSQGKIRLSDYEGSWLILFSHPADFTPVCTTEFIAFQEIYPQLREMNTELLGLSVDSVSSHISWIRNVEEKFGVKLEFPIIADLNKEVAQLYGMIMPEESSTETSRAVFVIDDKQIIRAIIYYPLTTGRNMDEILRLVKALQTTDQHGVATPANWREGDKVILPTPPNIEVAEERMKDESLECVDWYFCKKQL
ncbi:peroxiredoxin [Fervidibacillus halotolerans]|uniref:Peroxiredoxin n=1 Tax=Fervidibacillus halotolerans TaxID=2980027 RepID=A0A9E8RWL2_9BACI|nr:peroxiredoxin [Fervidibacillus halotolerans]WAA11880.1 peroxiredoxin [Fervidibacillus halotolerans]